MRRAFKYFNYSQCYLSCCFDQLQSNFEEFLSNKFKAQINKYRGSAELIPQQSVKEISVRVNELLRYGISLDN